MSNPWCHDGKSSPNSCHPVMENRQDLLLGWFKKLNVDDKEELIRELSTKVQGISMEKLPSEGEEDFKSRHFQELLKKLSSNSKRSVGYKILKAYLRVYHRSPNLHKKSHQLLPLDEHEEHFFQAKSIDSRQGLPCLQKQASTSDEDSSLKPELFKIKTLHITGGRPQGGPGSSDQQR
ncbi:hypothetical protein QQP08_025748 [Theobroma cacao]|nr:hypothetical protein QQP08_024082 [Theobroma cacao]WRX33261.1 hypothetical protein QQP08_025748 [Theobroma cacao]